MMFTTKDVIISRAVTFYSYTPSSFATGLIGRLNSMEHQQHLENIRWTIPMNNHDQTSSMIMMSELCGEFRIDWIIWI